ncbi:hypothetical protein [uncultured Halomonas sp.]|uniref:hypothetical protein n=1 Tax=uncultured Halomonas sp. TaxID=173971 RepID=UPI00262D6A79|nr:hypothetical protein [uncultured Halomonas sp.]
MTTRKIVPATKEITANIKGIEYDVMLIPKQFMVEMDFAQFPEDDPNRRSINEEKMAEVNLTPGLHFIGLSGEEATYRLTRAGARYLLDSLSS